MKLTLTEELMLLALDDNKGTIVPIADAYINYGMACALLLELAINERIALEDEGKVKPIEIKPLRNGLLQEAFDIIKASPKHQTISYWTYELIFLIDGFYQKLLDSLIEKKILKLEEKRVWGIFKRKRYPTINMGPEKDAIARVRRLVMEGGSSNARTVMLVSLVGASNLVNIVFQKKEERAKAKVRIDEISNNMIAGVEINRLLHDIQEAVAKACSSHLPIVST